MSVTVAKTAGFCFGVNRAVEVVFKCIEEGKKVCTLGEIIHNPQIVEKLSEKGALIIDSIDESLAGKTVVIRSHGVAESIYSQLNQYGISYVDATCPFVAKIHKIVSRYKDDAAILIAGDKKHPEVQGIVGHCKT
ncbi:MAG TPA: bifunctional 4-hydroxy-3-methylbut-2-enyl diphosphate reductase/30S ribosomal protein S1, partial [Ruminococcaceae bacterium]|nr:bifunctional 4-hydroxy-3-methylbut-2-enyl diphosphate reductase/30S ribosomal protein S1 [Oscillospiraceae bacterium]